MTHPTAKPISRHPASRNRAGRPMRAATLAGRAVQSGVMLLEALIGILIFSIGILAMVAMQATAITSTADAQYRVEAVNQANQLLSHIWMGVDRANPGALQASLLQFAHQTGGVAASCAYTGAPGNASVMAWANHLNSGGPSSRPLLPGSDDSMQQVVISSGVSNRVAITVCWRAPSAPTGAPSSRHTLIAYIN